MMKIIIKYLFKFLYIYILIINKIKMSLTNICRNGLTSKFCAIIGT